MRVCPSDLEKLNAIARRLRVRESEILRFALRLAFSKLSPLHDDTAHGLDLIPVFLKCGPELMYHFDMDARTLDTIMNGEVDDPREKVTMEDIELLAASHEMPNHHLHARLNGMPRVQAGHLDLSGALQQYLYNKYIGPKTDMANPNPCANAVQIPL